MKLSNRIITAVLLVAGSTGVVYAFSKHGDWDMSAEEKIEFISDRVARKLELDDLQRQKSGKASPVKIMLKPAPGRAIIEVVDRGVGIAEADLARLGEAFYRADSARQRNTGGYGLGLYLCRLICDAHGGDLRIDSEVGEGTRVIVSLPLDNS